MNMKETICTVAGLIGSGIASVFGGWTSGMTTLIIFMSVDYVAGLVVAGIFRNSEKTKSGGLESRVGWKGICRKGMSLVIVLIAHRLDLAIGTNYFRDAAIIAIVANELISIVENAGLMGIYIPPVIAKGIDILQRKVEKEDE